MFFNDKDELIIKYDLENFEIENISSFLPDYNLMNFNISNDDLKIFITCDMFNDELNPEPLTLHFNYSNDDNWNDVCDVETDFVNFVPYSSEIAIDFNESDSLFCLINVTDSLYSFGSVFLLTGSIDFLTEYSEEEISRPGYNLQYYPNPFKPSGAGRSPTTTISFNLTAEDTKNAELIIYNIKGQKIRSFQINQLSYSPVNQIIWNGTDENSKPVASGIYLYKLNINGKTKAVRKCLLLK